MRAHLKRREREKKHGSVYRVAAQLKSLLVLLCRLTVYLCGRLAPLVLTDHAVVLRSGGEEDGLVEHPVGAGLGRPVRALIAIISCA